MGRHVIYLIVFFLPFIVTGQMEHGLVVEKPGADSRRNISNALNIANSASSYLGESGYLVGNLRKISKKVLPGDREGVNSFSYRFIYLLLLLSLIFLASWFIIPTYVLIIKHRRVKRDKQRAMMETRYLRIIATYISSPDHAALPTFPRLKSNFNKQVLINQLYVLSISLMGKQRERLNHLYKKTQLQELLKKGIRSIRKRAKIRYLKYYSVRRMSYDQLVEVKRYLTSGNCRLRLASQLAVLNYEPRLLMDVLRDYPFHLTTWDQMHIFDLMLQRNSHPVDYYDFIEHSNPSVVIFALRMIRYLFLKNSREHEIVPLLSHSNEQIRYEALKTASDLNIEKVDKLLLAYISEINENYKELIIEFLIRNKLVSSMELLDFFHQEKDPGCKLFILQSIENKYPSGEDLIRELEQGTSDGDIRSMCLHVLEKSL